MFEDSFRARVIEVTFGELLPGDLIVASKGFDRVWQPSFGEIVVAMDGVLLVTFCRKWGITNWTASLADERTQVQVLRQV